MNDDFRFLIYRSAEEDLSVNAVVKDDTIWLTQKATVELFGVDRTTITKHLRNIFDEGELEAEAVCAKFAHTAEVECRLGDVAPFSQEPPKISPFFGGDFGGAIFRFFSNVSTARFAKRRRFTVESATSGSVRVVAPLRRLGALRRVEKFWVLGDVKRPTR